jgi:RHS repeat-associated protein
VPSSSTRWACRKSRQTTVPSNGAQLSSGEQKELRPLLCSAPSPASPATGWTLTYDAWNRLVKVANGQTTIAEYQYDGQNFRTVKLTYTSGQLSETRHFYYNDGWQCLEERATTQNPAPSPETLTPTCQYVWGDRYVDDLVLRDRDSDANGTLDERLYAMQDPNWNVIAIADTGGDVQRRFSYQAYGKFESRTSTFTQYGLHPYAWDVLYTGRQYDLETGLYNYRNRFQHAQLGRFLSRDPIAADINLYRYVRNMPSVHVDPMGHCTLAFDVYDNAFESIPLGTGANYNYYTLMGGITVEHTGYDSATVKVRSSASYRGMTPVGSFSMAKAEADASATLKCRPGSCVGKCTIDVQRTDPGEANTDTSWTSLFGTTTVSAAATITYNKRTSDAPEADILMNWAAGYGVKYSITASVGGTWRVVEANIGVAWETGGSHTLGGTQIGIGAGCTCP